MSGTNRSANPIPFGEAAAYWLKLGCISFGGPAGQIAIMHEEFVHRRCWISEKRFIHALNFCMVLPGPEAQQLATYLGWLMHGTWGGIVAGSLFVLPSLFVLMALSWAYMVFGHIPAIEGVFHGVKPAVTAIVVFAAFRIGSRILTNGRLWAIAVASFIALFALGIPFPVVVVVAAIVGYFGFRDAPEAPARPMHGVSTNDIRTALIDDDTPIPVHAIFSRARCVRVLMVCMALWSLAFGGMLLRYGWDGLLPQLAWFFTKAALLTFGGAYAVLPYVYQAAVEQFHWLTSPQMIDGLALGETTPGPLIMVVSYVGFVAGWTHAIAGVAPLASATLAACVVTFFTFLPSFLFIFLGAPFVESTHRDVRFTAPLAAITAAVAGVIANLATFFAYHVLWPSGFEGPFDPVSLAIGIAAAIALFRFKVGVIPVIVAASAAGFVVRLLA